MHNRTQQTKSTLEQCLPAPVPLGDVIDHGRARPALLHARDLPVIFGLPQSRLRTGMRQPLL